MNNLIFNQNDHHELQHLITASSGLVDTYVIECFENIPMLLPQNIILSAIDCETDAKLIYWHDQPLAVYPIHHPNRKKGVALVIEAENQSDRFVLLCDAMPKAVRIRISELVDDLEQELSPHIYQVVRFMGQLYQIPDLDAIQAIAQKSKIPA